MDLNRRPLNWGASIFPRGYQCTYFKTIEKTLRLFANATCLPCYHNKKSCTQICSGGTGRCSWRRLPAAPRSFLSRSGAHLTLSSAHRPSALTAPPLKSSRCTARAALISMLPPVWSTSKLTLSDLMQRPATQIEVTRTMNLPLRRQCEGQGSQQVGLFIYIYVRHFFYHC